MRIGFNCDQYGSDTQFQRDLDVVQLLAPGAKIRLDAVDEYVTLSNGSYDWSDLDRRVQRVTSRGLVPHFMVPYWTDAAGKAQPSDQATIDAHVRFCAALGQRYKAVVKSAELGNEANRKGDFAPDGAQPALQGSIARQVAAVLPRWKIMTMGFAPAPTSGGSMRPTDYMPAYMAAAGLIFDAVAIHPYGRAADASTSWSTLGQIPGIRARYGLPVWATEYNAWSGQGDGNDGVWVAQTLPWLASLKAGVLLRRYVPWTFMFAMSDPTTEGSGPHLGLLDANGNERPTFSAVAAYVKG